MTRQFYDLSLRHRLSPAGEGHGPVINPAFSEFHDHLLANLICRSIDVHALGIEESSSKHVLLSDVERYRKGEYRALLKRCREHAEEHSSPLTGARSAVVLVHPLYLQLCGMHHLDTREKEADARRYGECMFALLESGLPGRGVDVVLLETAHHYAAATSLLLEQGKATSVVFTEYDRGVPLRPDELRRLKDIDLYVAGGYNGDCLRSGLNYLRKHADKDCSRTYAIGDLVIESPEDFSRLCASRGVCAPVQGGYLPPDRVLSLEEALARIEGPGAALAPLPRQRRKAGDWIRALQVRPTGESLAMR